MMRQSRRSTQVLLYPYFLVFQDYQDVTVHHTLYTAIFSITHKPLPVSAEHLILSFWINNVLYEGKKQFKPT